MPNVLIVEQAKALREWSREVREASRAACDRARELLNEVHGQERERTAARRSRASSPREESTVLPEA